MRALEETIRYRHRGPEETPWITTGFPGYDQRLLHYRPEDEFFAVQLRAEPGVESPPHRHLGALYSVTTKGRWGHDRDYIYGVGVYVYEPVDVIHRFLVPPDEGTELFTCGFGGVEMLSEDGEVLASLSVAEQVEMYFQAGEAAGLPRPTSCGTSRVRAVRLTTYGEMPEVTDVVEPTVQGPFDVIVRIGGAGLCRTDLHILEGQWKERSGVTLPYVLGHENAGWVQEVGPAVTTLSVGDPVIVHPQVSCGFCEGCRDGQDMRCANATFPGLDVDGGFADLLRTSARSLGEARPLAGAEGRRRAGRRRPDRLPRCPKGGRRAPTRGHGRGDRCRWSGAYRDPVPGRPDPGQDRGRRPVGRGARPGHEAGRRVHRRRRRRPGGRGARPRRRPGRGGGDGLRGGGVHAVRGHRHAPARRYLPAGGLRGEARHPGHRADVERGQHRGERGRHVQRPHRAHRGRRPRPGRPPHGGVPARRGARRHRRA